MTATATAATLTSAIIVLGILFFVVMIFIVLVTVVIIFIVIVVLVAIALGSNVHSAATPTTTATTTTATTATATTATVAALTGAAIVSAAAAARAARTARGVWIIVAVIVVAVVGAVLVLLDLVIARTAGANDVARHDAEQVPNGAECERVHGVGIDHVDAVELGHLEQRTRAKASGLQEHGAFSLGPGIEPIPLLKLVIVARLHGRNVRETRKLPLFNNALAARPAGGVTGVPAELACRRQVARRADESRRDDCLAAANLHLDAVEQLLQLGHNGELKDALNGGDIRLFRAWCEIALTRRAMRCEYAAKGTHQQQLTTRTWHNQRQQHVLGPTAHRKRQIGNLEKNGSHGVDSVRHTLEAVAIKD